MPEGPHTGLPPSQTALKLVCLSSRSLGSFVAGGFLDPLLERLIRGAVGLGVLFPAQKGPAPEANEDPPPSPISQGTLVPAGPSSFLGSPAVLKYFSACRETAGRHTPPSPAWAPPRLPPWAPQSFQGDGGQAVLGRTLGGALRGGGIGLLSLEPQRHQGPRHLALWGNSRGKQRRPPTQGRQDCPSWCGLACPPPAPVCGWRAASGGLLGNDSSEPETQRCRKSGRQDLWGGGGSFPSTP